ncbi:hypothetical protein Taro_001036 [Colocasia esculenta]|uniref:Uncharacterized protein n=1 Tax=Colocasia esculenta TaxID=4460 RepID=A0A843TEV8_COLES|nr:hypothetical protein [Colocasia esculenta]
MSVLELAADRADSGAEEKTRTDSPLSLCLSLHWFQSHVVVLVVRLQLGQAAVVRTRASGGSHSVFSRLRGSVCGCQSVVASVYVVLTWLFRGLGRCAEGCFRSVSDSVGFCGSRVCGPTSVGGRGVVLFSSAGTGNPYWALFARLTPLLPSARGSSSRELGVGRVAVAIMAPCVLSSSESKCCELLYLSVLLPCMIHARVAGCSCCCAACVASVVARRVRAIAARLALDSLAVVLLVWKMLARQSRLRCIAWLPCVLVRISLRTNGALVVLVEALPEPACVASAVLLAAVFSLMVRVVWSWGLCILVKVLPTIALCHFWRRFFPGVLCVLVSKFLGRAGGTCVSLWLEWFASFLTPGVLLQMVVWVAMLHCGVSIALLCTGFLVGLLVQALFRCLGWRDLPHRVLMLERFGLCRLEPGCIVLYIGWLLVLVVALSVVRQALVVASVPVFPLALGAIVFGYGTLLRGWHVGSLAKPCVRVAGVLPTLHWFSIVRGIDIFHVSVTVCHVVECVTPSFCGPAFVWFLRVRLSSLLDREEGLGVKATCQVSRSPEVPTHATHGSEGLRPLAPPFFPFSSSLPFPLFSGGGGLPPAIRRYGEAGSSCGAAARSWSEEEVANRCEGPFVGWFLRSKGGCRDTSLEVTSNLSPSGSDRLAVAAVVAVYLWGSDDVLVAFLFPCRLAAGQWPRLGSGLLTLNAIGRYAAFKSEGGPMVVVT